MVRCSLRRRWLFGAVLVVVVGCSEHGEAPPESTPSTSSTTSSSVPELVSPAAWQLDPKFDRPVPSDTEIHVLVTERECASGQPPGERLQSPRVEADADRAVVTFFVASLLATQSTVTCPKNPAAPYVVELGGLLGERDLVDGGESFPLSRLNRMPLPTHALQRIEDAPIAYTGTLVGTWPIDAATGCAQLVTPAGLRTVWWPADTEVGFDPPELYSFGSLAATEGDAVAIAGGRASAGSGPDRCAISDFVWIGFDIVSPDPPPPPQVDADLDPACYEPFTMDYEGYTITIDRAIWCTLDAGQITIVTPEGTLVEGPTEWIINAHGDDLLLTDPHTGEPIVIVPNETYRAATFEHMAAVRSSD